MINDYYSIKNQIEYTFIIEHSKFICYIKGIESEEEAKSFILEKSKQNSLATHNCYAYIADEKGLIEKFSDDGEPQGTAGKPMLDALKKSNLKKVVAVISRYFGGIKLGAGRLLRVYSNVVIDGIKKAEVILYKDTAFYNVITDYDGYNVILRLQKKETFSIMESNFDEKISLKLAIPNDSKEKITKSLINATNGKIKLDIGESGYYPFMVK